MTDRIEAVKTLKDVVPLTEQLYTVARETNALEHENFKLAQEQAIKAEVKSVLDSWVRFEQQQREAEQAALVQTVQSNVEAELAKPAFRKQLLDEAMARIERESSALPIGGICADADIQNSLNPNPFEFPSTYTT